MRLFLERIIGFHAVSLVVFFAIGYCAEQIISRNLNDNQFHLQGDWHVKHKETNDILFIGNSRTFVHVDARFLSESLHKKVYCLSQDGREAKVLFYKLKKYLSLNTAPSEIFLQFDPYFINSRNDGTFYGKENFLGYIFRDRLEINHVFENEKGFENYEVYLPLKRYFSIEHGVHFLYNHLTNSVKADHELYKYGSSLQNLGWLAYADWSNPPVTSEPMNFSFIDSTLQLCGENDIHVTLIYPPQSSLSYEKVDPLLVKSLEAHATKRKLNFWNFNSDIYNNINLFYNHTHLNQSGSKIYTDQLLDAIISRAFETNQEQDSN